MSMATEQKEATRIFPRELQDLIDHQSVTILDMRRDWNESDRMIPGAIRVDPDGYEGYAPSLKKGRTVVTYCT
jgi:rhodanese-related sulfurtransferase